MFKVGDRVRYIGSKSNQLIGGEEGRVVDPRATFGAKVMFDKGFCWTCFPHHLELVNEGPVREVTRREIVPGNYGKVRVTEGCYVHCKSMSTAEELREAAHILNQIAEAME